MSGHSDHRIVDFEIGAGHMTKQINKSKDKMTIITQQTRKAKHDLEGLEARKAQRFKEIRQEIKDRAERLHKWVRRSETEMLGAMDDLEREYKDSSEQDAALLTKVEKKADASHVIFTSCDWANQSDSHLVLMNKFLSTNQSWFIDQRTMPGLATESFQQQREYFLPGSDTAAMLRNFAPRDILGEIRRYSSMKLPRFADKKFRVTNAATLKNNDLVLLEKCDSAYEVVVYTNSKKKHQGELQTKNYYEKYVSFTGSSESEITRPSGLAVCNDYIVVMETDKLMLLIFSKDGVDLGVHKFKDIPKSLAGNECGLFVGFANAIQWLVMSEDTDQSDSKVKVKVFKTLPLKVESEDMDSRWRYNMAVSENGDIIINPSGECMYPDLLTL
jgi:hypothetical protein